MTSVEKVITEIKGASAYITAQSNLQLSALNVHSMQASMCKSLCAMINTCQIDSAGQATDMLAAISVAPFSDPEKLQLSTAINARLTQAPVQRMSPHDKQTFETADAVNSYLTEADWTIINDTTSPFDASVKHLCVVKRLVGGGFCKPSETTIADIVCSLASVAWQDPMDKQRLYKHVQAVKECFATMPRTAAHLYDIKQFPKFPRSLPESHFNAMYGGAAAPVEVKLDDWHLHRKKISCRNTNKQLRDTDAMTIITPPSANQGLAQLMQFAQACGVGPQHFLQLGGMLSGMTGPLQMTQRQPGVTLDMAQPLPHIDEQPRRPASCALALHDAEHGLLSQHSSSSLESSPESSPQAKLQAVQLATSAHMPNARHVQDGCETLFAMLKPGVNENDQARAAADAVDAMETNHKDILSRDGAGEGNGKRKRGNANTTSSKKPAAAAARLSSTATPSMPAKDHHGSVTWKGAKILASESKNGWRVWYDATVKEKEIMVPFKGDKRSSWDQVIKLIKNHNK
jgi:hypothetical protein